ncbi:translocation/assembly module TamB domain-containing protein [Candidatus Colwellia aromaticivorans]|uniref:translocation/assembly module TamB domain-containing protein n=1 Tax=Candidatus Colwellia aromaticivorans TaxID=2267621 RepID=UPI00109B78D2|nr:translocation/assembly module TamB domain-containing protein [Candidatus Colwellia aromaticivorans]
MLNNIDGINADYKAGSLVRDIELNSLHLNLETLDIRIKDLAVEIDFSCSWKKELCLDSIRSSQLLITYTDDSKNKKSRNEPETVNDGSLFVMPFAIKVQAVELTKSHLVINQTLIDIEQFTAQVEIKTSQFTILHPNASRLTIALESNENSKNKKSNAKDTGNSVHVLFSTLPEVHLPVALNIQQLFVDELRIIDQKDKTNDALKNDVQWPYQQSHLTVTWVKSDVNITNFQTSTVDYSIKHLAVKTQLIPPYKINAKLTTQLHEIPLWPEASNSIVAISLQGAVDDLTVNAVSQGSLVFNSQAHINLTYHQLPFSLQLSADKLPLPLYLAQYGQPSSLSLAVQGDLIKQTVNLSSQLNSYGYKNGQLSLTAKHQHGAITLNELTFNDKGSDSQLNLHGNIDFQSTGTNWELFADSSGFTLPQVNLKALVFPESTNVNTNANTENKTNVVETMLPDVIKGRVLGKIASTGIWSESQWSFSVNDTDVSGTINNYALIIQGDIALNQSGYFSSGNLSQGELLVALGKDQLTLQTFRDNNWHVNGQLFIDNISHWYQDASGSISSDFSIKGNKENPIITLNTKLKKLNWQQFYSSSLEVIASYQPFNYHKTQLTVKNDHLVITGKSDIATIDKIAFNFSGDIYQQQLKVDWQGDLSGNLKLTSQWDEALNLWQSSIEQAGLTYQQMTWRNNKVFSLDFDLNKQQFLIDKHCWQGKGLDICLPLNTSVGKSGDITLTLNIDLSLMDELILPEEVQLKSKISGEIKALWSPTQAIWAKANFALSPGHIKVNNGFTEQQISQWHKGELSFSVSEAQLTSKLQLKDAQEEVLIETKSKVNFIDDFPIDAQIILNQFNLHPFQAVISNVVNLQGSLTAMLTIEGTIKSPLINGNLALHNGELLLSHNPNKFENISAELQINNKHVEMVGEFYIKESKATLKGQLAWQDSLTMDIDLKAKDLPLVFPAQLVMNISPTLNFSLKKKSLSITGNLDVLEGSYNIENLPEGSISLSDDVIIVDQQGKEIFKETSEFNIETNVRVNIAKAFEVSGQGLQSHLFGQLQISQKDKRPLQLFGSIQSDNGTYQAYGQKLNIEKGKLTFNGPIDNPYFNLRASRHIKAENIEVGLQITGLAETLDMQLFSTPTMERPEMLSYLARGRGLDSGGGNSTAAASMLIGFGVTNSVGLFDQIEKLSLISNIALDTEGEGETTQATISGYIGNRVYLKYGVGVYEPINELTVRLYLLNRLWLEIVSGFEQSSDLYYSFDVD